MASDKPERVIIDTDPGVDDAQAILFALRLKASFQIEAVTTVFGNCPVTTATPPRWCATARHSRPTRYTRTGL